MKRVGGTRGSGQTDEMMSNRSCLQWLVNKLSLVTLTSSFCSFFSYVPVELLYWLDETNTVKVSADQSITKTIIYRCKTFTHVKTTHIKWSLNLSESDVYKQPQCIDLNT